MINFLRRFLGFDLLEFSKQAHIDALAQQLVYAHYELVEKDQEIKRLTDLFLTEHGVIHPEVAPDWSKKEKPQPIGRRASFRTIRNKFEAADAKMAQEIAKDQVEKLSDYWTKKNQEAAKEA